MNNLNKLKYEISNKQMFDYCGLNVYALLHYTNKPLDFNLFEYICNFGNILEFPTSLLSLISMYDPFGNPRSVTDVLYKKYIRVIMGNQRLSYLKEYITSLSLEQLKFYFDTYLTIWKNEDLLYNIFANKLYNKHSIIYYNIYLNNKHHLIHFKYINDKIECLTI